MCRPDPARSARSRHHWFPTVLVIALSAAAMGPVLGNDFVEWDDGATIYAQPALNPPTLHSLAQFWTHPYMSLYVPLTHTTWWIIATVAHSEKPDASGALLNPLAFHA